MLFGGILADLLRIEYASAEGMMICIFPPILHCGSAICQPLIKRFNGKVAGSLFV